MVFFIQVWNEAAWSSWYQKRRLTSIPYPSLMWHHFSLLLSVKAMHELITQQTRTNLNHFLPKLAAPLLCACIVSQDEELKKNNWRHFLLTIDMTLLLASISQYWWCEHAQRAQCFNTLKIEQVSGLGSRPLDTEVDRTRTNLDGCAAEAWSQPVTSSQRRTASTDETISSSFVSAILIWRTISMARRLSTLPSRDAPCILATVRTITLTTLLFWGFNSTFSLRVSVRHDP